MRVRSRPLLFVGHARFWRLRRVVRSLRPHRLGVVAPLAVAAVLAVAGSEVSAPPTVATGAPAIAAPAALAPVGSAATRQSVARTQPSRATRATRSTQRAAIARPEWVRPSRAGLTSYYGMRWGRMHRGLDFGAAYGSPIYAASDGVVTFAGPEGGFGRLVLIRHKGGWITAYGHMSRFTVHVGQRVTAGEVIAYVGSAGHSTGPHLHFEVRTTAGGWVNPLPFLREHGVRV